MLKRIGWPLLFMLIGLYGLVGYGLLTGGDGDPQLYYLSAGKCLGKTSWYFCRNQAPDNGLYLQAMLHGGELRLDYQRMVPYRDFVCEYPPAALVTFILPRLFTNQVRTYYWLFSAEMAIPALGLWWVGIRIAQLLRPTRAVYAAVSAAWMLWVWASGRILLHRFDLAAVFFVAAAALFVLRRRWGLAGLCLGLGIALKVYPIFLLLPVAILAFEGDRWSAALRVLGVSAIAPVLSHLVMLPFTGLTVFSYLTYHSARGIEVESIWAQLVFFFDNPNGNLLHTATLFGCDQLVSSRDLHPWVLASYAGMILSNLLCIAISYFGFSRVPSGSLAWRVRVVALFLGNVTFTIAVAKVLSIQYVFWLFPLAMVLPGRAGGAIAILYVIALALGHLWFPDYWNAVTQLTMPGMLLVFARNLMLIAIAVWSSVIAAGFVHTGPKKPSQPGERSDVNGIAADAVKAL